MCFLFSLDQVLPQTFRLKPYTLPAKASEPIATVIKIEVKGKTASY
jgi:hypothetical protein